MKNRKGKFVLYAILMIGAILIGGNFVMNKYNSKNTQSSLLALTFDIKDEVIKRTAPPDISIEKITLHKVSDPSPNFNYYRYKSTIVIHNYGGDIKAANITIQSGDNQKHSFLRNNENGFYLDYDNTFILEDYEVLFDGNFNGGKVSVSLKILDQEEFNLKNNSYTVDIFELPANIDNIGVKKILENNMLLLDFKIPNEYVKNNKFEIYTVKGTDLKEEELRYAEVFDDKTKKVLSYYRVKNSKDIINSNNWLSTESQILDSYFFPFPVDLFTNKDVYYLFIKATNNETGYYGVSNVIKFVPYAEMNKAEFANILVKDGKINIDNRGEIYFEDVDSSSWYAPYVQTLYNLGLISANENKYRPDNLIKRSEILSAIFDYYDVDLQIKDDAPHFSDLNGSENFYPYVETLYASGKSYIFGDSFNADSYATKEFLKYLIYEYSKSN
ncbi:MAG: S-layer homology domain-containing protein [Candidatus Gracilibacteria bacterium]|jgi:hypothetical protein